jgi:superfamily II DNA/RNA helicase
MLRAMIRDEGIKNAIIFCNRKVEVAILLKSLMKHGFNAGALHGDMDQKSRMETLDRFRSGEITVLAASDVAARGLDIPDVSHVFNFDLPWQSDDYVHRIGRTGRAGKQGTACSIVTVEDLKSLKDIEKMLGETVVWQGDGPSEEDYANAGKRRRGRGGRGATRDSGRGARGPDRGQERRMGRDRAPERREHHEGSARREHRGERPRQEREPDQRPRGDAPGLGEQPAIEARAARPERGADRSPRRDEPRQPRREREGDRREARSPEPRANQSEPRDRQPRPPRDTAAEHASRPQGGQRQKQPVTGAQPGNGFADNVPAFLRRPPRPAKTANE